MATSADKVEEVQSEISVLEAEMATLELQQQVCMYVCVYACMHHNTETMTRRSIEA